MTKTEIWRVPAGARFIDATGEAAEVLWHGRADTDDGEVRVARVQTEGGAEFVVRGDLLVLSGAVH